MSTAVKVDLKFQDGDRVRVIDREPGAPDAKAVTYYPFYRHLTGKVIKAYNDNSVAVDIDRSALPAEIRERHERSETLMRDKWLAGLGEEEREKLSERAKRFHLRYTLLLSANDLVIDEKKTGRANRASEAGSQSAVSESARKTQDDLLAAEEAYLRSVEQNKLAN
ncbi:MAG: hypothetical protein P4L33_06905 [Capsulimonadaceae bacterium]|nr:hypothetical protein [Capsulimonadaceae bacterium]